MYSKSHHFIEKIKQARIKNNDLWVKLLEIALEANPEKTKIVLKEIRKNDIEIYSEMGKLTEVKIKK